MTFDQALRHLQAGAHLKRATWQSGEEYIFLVTQPTYQQEPVNPYFLIRTKEQPALSVFQPTDCDLLATDWTIVA